MRRMRAFLVFAVVASGCGGNDGGTGASPQIDGTGTTSTTAPVTTTSAAVIELPAPIEYGAATYVVGRMDLVMDLRVPPPDPDGTVRFRDVRVTGTTTSVDPRLTGTVEAVWNADFWGTGPENGALVQWGTSSITTAAGTWQGTETGGYTTETSDQITLWYTGTGAYEGLSMFVWITESDTYGPLDHAIYALIFPGIPPTP